MFKWFHRKCEVKLDSLREAQLQAITRIRKEVDIERKQLLNILKKLSTINKRYCRPSGDIAVQVIVPIREIMERFPCDRSQYYVKYLAKEMGYMLEREMSQLNMVTLARELDDTNPRSRVY